MSKTWKCTECVKYGTDACFNGGRYDYDDCKYKLVDADYAYQQGREDAIDECIEVIREHNALITTLGLQNIMHDLEELKEQKNNELT